MTEAIAALFRKIAESRLREIAAEEAELRAALRELNGHADDSARLRVGLNELPGRESPPSPKPPPINPSSQRLDELRDAHGPVFRITPKAPGWVGQVLTNADGSKIELLEMDDRGNETGVVAAGSWFGKRVE